MKIQLGSSTFGLLLAVVYVPQVNGQSYQGGVRGLVTDKQHAAVAHAHATLDNETAGTARTRVTNTDGQYAFPAVEPAVSAISVAASGFAKIERKSVTVGTQQFLTLD